MQKKQYHWATHHVWRSAAHLGDWSVRMFNILQVGLLGNKLGVADLAYTKTMADNCNSELMRGKMSFWKSSEQMLSSGLICLSLTVYPPCSAPSRQQSGSISGCLGSTSTLMDTLFPANIHGGLIKNRLHASNHLGHFHMRQKQK